MSDLPSTSSGGVYGFDFKHLSLTELAEVCSLDYESTFLIPLENQHRPRYRRFFKY